MGRMRIPLVPSAGPDRLRELGLAGSRSPAELGSIFCLLARGVINNHLPATGRVEASQKPGAA